MRLLTCFLCLLLATATLAEEPFPQDYYDGLKDGLTVEDLEKLTPLDADQKLVAKSLLVYFQKYPADQLQQCSSNLKNLGTASEMWSTDYDGKFPETANSLYPSYLLVALSCPTTDLVPYKYSLKDGLYTWVCPGDHSALGIEPPTYNGERGLDWGEPQQTDWHLVSYAVETPDPQFAPNSPKVTETWASREQKSDFHSQLELDSSAPAKVSRCWGLTNENVSVGSNTEFIALLDADIDKSDAIERLLRQTYSKMSPATVGMIIVEFVTNPEYADSFERMKKNAKKASEED